MMIEKKGYPGDMTRFIKGFLGNKPLLGAEIGVLNGDHALRILETLRLMRLYLIDPYLDYPEYRDHNKHGVRDAIHTAIHKLSPYSEQTRWLFVPSLQAASFIAVQLDFVYIDGNHARDYVRSDLLTYFQKIAVGGVIGGHDYYTRKDPDNLCEVQEVVDEFAEITGSSLYLDSSDDSDWPDWWFIKDQEMVQKVEELRKRWTSIGTL